MENLISKFRTVFFSSILIVLCSNSCFESDPPNRCNWEQDYNNYLSSYNAFATRPNAASCENLKTQGLQMIDKFGDCEEFLPYVADLRSVWNSLNCSAF